MTFPLNQVIAFSWLLFIYNYFSGNPTGFLRVYVTIAVKQNYVVRSFGNEGLVMRDD